MSSQMAIFVDNGISGASHGVRLRKALLVEEGFLSSEFVTLSGSKILSVLIGLVILLVKYRFPPSLIAAKFLRSAKVASNLGTKILYIDTLHLSFLCERIHSEKYIVNFHNYDPEYLLELARLEKSFFKSVVYRYESFISKMILRRLAKDDRCEMWALTSKDVESVRQLLKDSKNIKLVPHKLPKFRVSQVSHFQGESSPFIDLLFIGAGGHKPNTEALAFMINLLNYDDRFVAHIVGPNWQTQNHPRLKFHGFVKDLSVFFESKMIFVCPVFSGSGINMKIMTAIELGIPGVLSHFTRTPFNVYGEDFPDGKYDVVVGQDLKSWTDSIINRFELVLARQ